MDSNVQLNYNYGAPVTPAPRPDPNAPLYASEDAVVASLSNSECVFQVKRTGEPHVMTFQVLQALDQCREFRTLDEHVSRIVTTVPGLNAQQREAVSRVLQSLIQRGLLVSDADFVARLSSVTHVARPNLRAVFIRACDRPSQLERLLATLSDYERRFRAARPYVVLDDSKQEASLDRHRDLVREFARTTGCKLTYIGPAERARFAERVGKALPAQKEAISTLLLPRLHPERFGGGRSWNLATLLSAGGSMVLMDDDQRLPMRRHDLAIGGMAPNAAAPFARFQRNMEEALSTGEEIAEDPFGMHLDACAQPLAGLLAQPGYRIERESLRGLDMARLAHLNPDARVIATQQGTYGSARSESALWLYHLDAAGRADFCASRDAYLTNVEAQSLWQSTQQARLLEYAQFTPFAFDNSRLLPCTSPVGRGEDALFSAVAHFCQPDALVLDLPVAIGHVQERARKRSANTLSASTPRVNHFLTGYVQRQFGQYLADDPAQRLQLLGEIVRDLAGASESARISHLREYLNFVRADTIERLQQQFESATDAPVFWQADVRAAIEANGRAMLAKAPPRLGDWADDLDSAGCANALREELNTVASQFEAWPAAWTYAREQGEKLLATV
ncbi:MAG: hypothetical protein ABI411_09255 [Tahibacter sp.]